MKRQGGSLSRTRPAAAPRGILAGQADAFPRLEAAGMRLALCAGLDDVVGQPAGLGVPLRP